MSIWHFLFGPQILQHCSCESLTEVAELLVHLKSVTIVHHQSFQPTYTEHIHAFVKFPTLNSQNIQRVKKALLHSNFGKKVTDTNSLNEYLKSVRSEIPQKDQKQFLNSLLYGSEVTDQILAANNIQLVSKDNDYSRFLQLIYLKGSPSYNGNLKPCEQLFPKKVLRAAGFFASDDEHNFDDVEEQNCTNEDNNNDEDDSLTTSENKASKKYDYLQSVIQRTKSENLSQLQKRLTPQDFKDLFIYVGVNWKNYLTVIFEANAYAILSFENTLSYVEKLQHKFQDRLVLAQKNGSLHDGVGWLQQFLISNKINVSKSL